MRVTLLQTDIRWGDIGANCREAARLIASAPGSDLYVLPEMWSTGFAARPGGPTDEDGASLRWMRGQARLTGAAVCGSVAARAQDGTLRNRLYFVTPDGGGAHYDKRHLFTPSGEHLRFTPGRERVCVEWRGARLLLQVCYDLRFPCFSRNDAERPYDAAVYVASWPAARAAAWHALLRARAIENQCYALGVNRAGSDPSCRYAGGTELLGPEGDTLAACPGEGPGLVTGDVEPALTRHVRESFPALRDRD